jgi:hypothetical protein
MKTRNIACLTVSLVFATLACSTAWGSERNLVDANITRVLISAGTYGGCMAAVTVDPSTQLPACGQWWVSFECQKDNSSDSVIGYRMLDQAQMALALNKKVLVTISDATIYNGYCVVKRMDIY